MNDFWFDFFPGDLFGDLLGLGRSGMNGASEETASYFVGDFTIFYF